MQYLLIVSSRPFILSFSFHCDNNKFETSIQIHLEAKTSHLSVSCYCLMYSYFSVPVYYSFELSKETNIAAHFRYLQRQCDCSTTILRWQKHFACWINKQDGNVKMNLLTFTTWFKDEVKDRKSWSVRCNSSWLRNEMRRYSSVLLSYFLAIPLNNSCFTDYRCTFRWIFTS